MSVDLQHPTALSAKAPTLSVAMARLRLRHLQVLDALERLGSLRQAALALAIKQPVVLSMIDDLEHAVGVALVVRSRSGTQLTPAARGLLSRSRVALEEVALAQQQALRGNAAGGRLRIGASPYLIAALMPDLIAALRRARPGIVLDVHEGTLDALVAELTKGELDAVLGSVDRAAMLSSSVSLDATPLVAESLIVVAGRGHALQGRDGSCTLTELVQSPWVLPPVSSHIRGLVDAAVFACGGTPIAPQVEVRGIQNLLAIAATAGLLTVAPRGELLQRRWRGRVSGVVSPLVLPAPPYLFVSRRYVNPLPEVDDLRALAKSLSQRLFGPGQLV